MENKNKTIIISFLALIVGFFLGYFFGVNAASQRGFFSDKPMYEETEEREYGDEMVSDDGELQHMMDEMMLIGRGKTGEAYEEAWLRGMVAHHQGAIGMSEELLKRTDRPELVELANNIIESQSAEVGQMKAWIQIWFSKN